MSKPLPNAYAALQAQVKERVPAGQDAVLRAVNKEMVAFCWDIGRTVAGK
jgi:hypothetical protein